MEVRLLLLADFANVDSAGKLNIIGAFNQLFAQTFPTKHPLMYLVARLSAELGEYNQERTFRVILFDEDGNEKWRSPDLPFEIKAPESGRTAEFHPILQLHFTAFEKPGRYEYRIYINGDSKGAVPLDVLPMPQAPEG